MRKRLAASIAVLSLALLAGCGEEDGGAVNAPSFDAELPPGWAEGDDDDLELVNEAAVQGAASALGVDASQLNINAEAVWFGESTGDFTTNINVLAEEIPPAIDQDRYVEISLGAVGQLPGIEDFEEVGVSEVGGEEGETIEYSAAQPSGEPLRFRAIALVRSGQGFNITLTAADDSFDDASEDLNEILGSWQWTD